MKRSRKGIELKTKYLCLKELENGQKRKVLAEKYGIRENSISDWVKKKDEIYSRYESGECSSKQKYGNRSYKYDKADKALFTWFNQQRTNNVPLSGPLCVEKANQFAKHLYGADAVIS